MSVLTLKKHEKQVHEGSFVSRPHHSKCLYYIHSENIISSQRGI